MPHFLANKWGACIVIDLDRMYECEVRFPARFTNLTERDYGWLFHNADNPLSWDSNHAIIFNLDGNLDSAVDDVMKFYDGIGMKARFYPGFQRGEVDALRPVLERHGFKFEEQQNEYFLLRGTSNISPNPDVEIRRIREIDQSTAQLLQAEQGSDRTVRILQRHLSWETFHCLVGYVKGRAVTMGSFEEGEGCARVDNVLTHPECRTRGYCSALIHHMVEGYRSVSCRPLYLWATNPLAVKVYRNAGFVDFAVDRQAWNAWLE